MAIYHDLYATCHIFQFICNFAQRNTGRYIVILLASDDMKERKKIRVTQSLPMIRIMIFRDIQNFASGKIAIFLSPFYHNEKQCGMDAESRNKSSLRVKHASLSLYRK